MKEYYYLDRLKVKLKYADYLHYELDRRIYSYGKQQDFSFEKIKWKFSVFIGLFVELLIYLFLRISNLKLLQGKSSKIENLISTAYHGFGISLKNSGFSIIGAPWVISKNINRLNFVDFIQVCIFRIKLLTADFNCLLTPVFEKEIDGIKLLLGKYLVENKVRGVFLAQDSGFFEKLIIDEAKLNGIPTFIVLHGAGMRYGNSLNDNRADYVCVFGDIIKEKLILSGFNSKKIIVTGHPQHSYNRISSFLKFGVESVLVLTKPMPGQPLNYVEKLKGRSRDTNRLKDRGNLILYLMDIQSALIKVGVNKAKLRLHPSESPNWYLKYIDTNFFSIDKLSLSNSLAKSSLVIGPTSSLFFDAIYAGVNYMIYEPIYDDGLDILNDPVGHPFDGGDTDIPVAKDVDELIILLKSKKLVNLKSIGKFINPNFNIHEVINILK